MNRSTWIWDVGEIPFIYKPLAVPTNKEEGLPDFLPFSLELDENTGTLIQSPNEEVAATLHTAYQKGSIISGMMDENDLGKRYAEDFLQYLTDSMSPGFFKEKRVLEIGCGTGYFLSRLKGLGAQVVGIEPGAHGEEGALKYGVPIIRDFFPSEKVQDKFDLVILYAVLEHISQPVEFLKKVKDILNEDGRIAIAVPNCEPYIQFGDISMLFHEHWNYYTSESLQNTIQKALSFNISISYSNFGGFLYGITSKESLKSCNKKVDVVETVNQYNCYKKLAIDNIIKLENHLQDEISQNRSIGIYVPGRVVNILSLLKKKVDLSKIRFFDDNKALYRTYFPGITIPIESREDFFNNLVDHMIIMSHSFGKKIAEELQSNIRDHKIAITTWEQLFIMGEKE